jgi:hypothetical protein
MHGVRQNQLLRDIQHGAALRQIGIHTRVGFQHVGQSHLVFSREIFQRLLVVIRNRNHLVLTNQSAAVGRQRISDSGCCVAKADEGEGCR